MTFVNIKSCQNQATVTSSIFGPKSNQTRSISAKTKIEAMNIFFILNTIISLELRKSTRIVTIFYFLLICGNRSRFTIYIINPWFFSTTFAFTNLFKNIPKSYWIVSRLILFSWAAFFKTENAVSLLSVFSSSDWHTWSFP